MSNRREAEGHAANWTFLLAAIGEAADHLERYAATRAPAAGSGPAEVVPATDTYDPPPVPAMKGTPAIDQLCAHFNLTPFERDVILLGAGMELDPRFPDLCLRSQGDAQRRYPTFGLALAALPGSMWNALTPEAPLRWWRLVDVSNGPSLLNAELRLDERILHYLVGLDPLDDRLSGFIEPVAYLPDADAAITPSQKAVARQMRTAWAAPDGGLWPVLQIAGPDPAVRQAVAAMACALSGLDLYCLSAHTIPAAPAEFRGLLRLWERESRLAERALLLELDGTVALEPAQAGLALQLAESVAAPIILSTREQHPLPTRVSLTFHLPRSGAAEMRALWSAELGKAGVALADAPESESSRAWTDALTLVAGQFSLSVPALRAAVSAALATLPKRATENGQLERALWEAARQQARPRLGALGARVESGARLDDLVLPEAQKDILKQVVVHVRRRYMVYEEWGFAERMPRGLGVTCLFTGPSGTGKTLAAEVLAQRLNLDLYHIDLSQVVSKYIGDTEKHLSQVFDGAEGGGIVLFFDEADALFGKRSEVKDSHDRYANIEVSYLLQRMEAYRGLAILASNMEDALDPAFVRRLRFVVRFPMPGPAERKQIWRRIFPEKTRTEGLDYEILGRLNIPGGSIRNIALHAAFLAAEEDTAVQMQQILQAAAGEYARLGRPLTEGEIRGWR